jgi:aminoglycoside phosphotransferase (APT) family kinase protein
MHEGQLSVTTLTVRRLIESQFPEWAALSVARVSSPGTVNSLFRIGDSLVARFPLQPGDPGVIRGWLEEEFDASSELRRHTRFKVPEPVALGEPGEDYPLPWILQTWIPGRTAVEVDCAQWDGLADDLAEFIHDVRGIDTRGRTFSGGGRGGDLRALDEWMDECFTQSVDILDVPRLRLIWGAMRQLPRTSVDVMSHNDLIATNIIVEDGHMSAVLDVGGLGPADPALDLICAWNILDLGPRRALRKLLGSDDLE